MKTPPRIDYAPDGSIRNFEEIDQWAGTHDPVWRQAATVSDERRESYVRGLERLAVVQLHARHGTSEAQPKPVLLPAGRDAMLTVASAIDNHELSDHTDLVFRVLCALACAVLCSGSVLLAYQDSPWFVLSAAAAVVAAALTLEAKP